MNKDKTMKEIYKVILESTESEVDIEDGTDLVEEMGLSSMEVMVLLSDLEHEFKIMFPMDQLLQVRTVGELADIAWKQMKRESF